jgi:hypothetical protein
MNKGDIMRGSGAAIVIGFAIFCFYAWGSNFMKLTECDFESPYKCETIRAVGVIPPIGIITGIMNFEFDGK